MMDYGQLLSVGMVLSLAFIIRNKVSVERYSDIVRSLLLGVSLIAMQIAFDLFAHLFGIALYEKELADVLLMRKQLFDGLPIICGYSVLLVVTIKAILRR